MMNPNLLGFNSLVSSLFVSNIHYVYLILLSLKAGGTGRRGSRDTAGPAEPDSGLEARGDRSHGPSSRSSSLLLLPAPPPCSSSGQTLALSVVMDPATPRDLLRAGALRGDGSLNVRGVCLNVRGVCLNVSEGISVCLCAR